MPEKIIKKFQKKYGKKKGKSIFYATAAKQGRDPHTFHKEDIEPDPKVVGSVAGEQSRGSLRNMDAIEIRTDALDLIARTLNEFDSILQGLGDVALKRAKAYRQINGRNWAAFTDGNATIIVDPSGYGYPRYKTPKIDNTSLLTMYDWQIEKLMGRKENYNPAYVYPTNIGVPKHFEERMTESHEDDGGCEKCDGTGRLEHYCSSCGGSGCRWCKGSGETYSKCPRCHGTGNKQVEEAKMPAKWDKTVAKHSKEASGKGTTPAKISKYRKEATKEAEKRSDVKDPQAYATAVALRRAQKTGSKPHKKLSEGADESMTVTQEVEVILDGRKYKLEVGDKIRVVPTENDQPSQ